MTELTSYNFTSLLPNILEITHGELFKRFKCRYAPSDADILVCDNSPIDIKGQLSPKYVVCNMTNTDHIKIGPETTMINLRGETEFLQNIYSTAHHTIYLLLSLVRPKDRDHGPGTSLYKKTAAIIGSGRVGKQVAKLLRAFGMIVFSYDVNDKIRPDMDFYFIHASTGNGFALGPEAIRKIASNKKKSYVINTARPELVHTNTLINNSMDLGGIAYDFEIKTPKCPFSKTNHVGGYTKEDLQATGKFCFSKLLWHIATGTNQVNRATYLVAKRSNIYNCEKGTIDSYYRWRQYVQNEK